MDDRTLLELAAKAAGIELVAPVERFIVQFEERHKGGFIVRNSQGGDSAWNPLRDDGDALRLAVKLRIQITPGTYNKDQFSAFRAAGGEAHEFWSTLQDENAATRRAITRAAAAIGESK